MSRIVVVMPGLLALDGESVMRTVPPNFARLVDQSEVVRLTTPPEAEMPEAFILGMPPGIDQLRPGPLAVSAFGADPPDRSTHFLLSIGSMSGDVISAAPPPPTAKELERIVAIATKLNMRLVTFVQGAGLDHALVWEKEGDLGTHSLPASYSNDRPEGDGESMLRRYIDDSVNLLRDEEFNMIRIDTGVAPLNVLWPWGHGIRYKLPNLALRRGAPAKVLSNSMRLEGLVRLVGYRHGKRSAFGSGTNTKFAYIIREAMKESVAIVAIDAAIQLREKNQIDELDWLVREFDREFLGPVANATEIDLTFCTNGLAFRYSTTTKTANRWPFDERVLEEAGIPKRDLWSVIEKGILPP